jgi:hypothetical protein
LKTILIIFNRITAKLSRLLKKRAAITQVLCAVRHHIAVMADIAGIIRSGSNLISQALFLQLAEMQVVG